MAEAIGRGGGARRRRGAPAARSSGAAEADRARGPHLRPRPVRRLQRQRLPGGRSASSTRRRRPATIDEIAATRSSAARAATTSAAASSTSTRELAGADRRHRRGRAREELAARRHRRLPERHGRRRLPRLQRVQVGRSRSGAVDRAAAARRRRPRPPTAARPVADFLYEPAKGELLDCVLPLYVEIADPPRAARVDRLRVRRAHDRDGERHQATPAR